MRPDDPFLQRVKAVLIPDLRLQGFRGRFPTFRRINGPLIHEVSVQGWRYGGQRTVNLAFGFTFIQSPFDSPTSPETEYSYRIGTLNGRDRWWEYTNPTQAEGYALADNMIAVYRAEAPKFFERFKAFPESFAHFTPDDFVNAPPSYLPPRIGGGSVARDCWVFMRMWQHLGDRDRAVSFAKFGLDHVGRATVIKQEFLATLNAAL